MGAQTDHYKLKVVVEFHFDGMGSDPTDSTIVTAGGCTDRPLQIKGRRGIHFDGMGSDPTAATIVTTGGCTDRPLQIKGSRGISF